MAINYQVNNLLSSKLWGSLSKNIQSLKIQPKNYKIRVVLKLLNRESTQCLFNRTLKVPHKSRKFNNNSNNSWIINLVQQTKCYLWRRMLKIKCSFIINNKYRIRLKIKLFPSKSYLLNKKWWQQIKVMNLNNNHGGNNLRILPQTVWHQPDFNSHLLHHKFKILPHKEHNLIDLLIPSYLKRQKETN